jgi:CBS-domain-containing membrane protein
MGFGVSLALFIMSASQATCAPDGASALTTRCGGLVMGLVEAGVVQSRLAKEEDYGYV